MEDIGPADFPLSADWWKHEPARTVDEVLFALGVIEKPLDEQRAVVAAYLRTRRADLLPAAVREAMVQRHLTGGAMPF